MSMTKILVPVALVAAVLSGCVVQERTAARPGCPNAVWIEGHYGPRGVWHPAHWNCGPERDAD
jgi:hypothetical protein